jgi:copper transport protein
VDGFPSALAPVVRSAVFASHALIFGLVPILLLVLRPAAEAAQLAQEGRSRVGRRAEALAGVALLVAMAGATYALVSQSAETADLAGEPLGADSLGLVLQTQFGAWHLARFPVCIALLALLLGRVRTWGLRAGDIPAPARWWGLWGVLAAVLLASISMAGHAAAAEVPLVAVSNDVLHLAAGATWITGVVALTWLLPAAWAGGGALDQLSIVAPAVDRFARIAPWAIGIVVATGLVNSLTHLGLSPGALIRTGYGRALSIKLLGVVGIVALGAINHFVSRRRLLAGLAANRPVREQTTLRRAVAVEVLLAAFVLGVTGVLVGLAPPE